MPLKGLTRVPRIAVLAEDPPPRRWEPDEILNLYLPKKKIREVEKNAPTHGGKQWRQ
jgi:hypothetical protein